MSFDSEASLRAAAVTQDWLNSLGSHAAERQELLTRGVARRTALALYPLDFATFVPHLRVHLRAFELDEFRTRPVLIELHGVTSALIALSDDQSAALRSESFAAWNALNPLLKGKYADLVHTLHADISAKLVGDSASELTAYSCVAGLWCAWWHTEQLRQQRAIDPENHAAHTLHWFGVHLLHLPSLPSATFFGG